MLQHIRDEAHRFAITYHRQRRDRRALSSPLDEIPGVGPSRKRALMKRFGSLTKIRQAEPAELAATPGRRPPARGRDPPPAARGRGLRPTGERADGSGREARRRGGPRPRRGSCLITGPVGCRTVRGRAQPRGPRVLRRRQPAAGAAAEDGGARREPRRTRPRRDRRGRSRRRVLRRALQSPRGAARAAGPVADRLPGRLGRRPRQPLRGDPPASPARARRPGRRGHPQGAADDGEPPGRRRPRDRHHRADAARPPRPDARDVRARRRRRPASSSRSSRSASSTGARATRTSCWTSGSSPTRIGWTSCAPCPGTNEKVREYVEGQEEYGSFMKRLEALLEVVVPGYVDEGKSYLTVAIGCTGGRHRSVVVGGRPRRLLPRARPSRLGDPPRHRPRLKPEPSRRFSRRGTPPRVCRGGLPGGASDRPDAPALPDELDDEVVVQRADEPIELRGCCEAASTAARRVSRSMPERSIVDQVLRRVVDPVRSPTPSVTASFHLARTKRSQKAMCAKTPRSSTADRGGERARRQTSVARAP